MQNTFFLRKYFIYSLLMKSKKFSFFTYSIQYNDLPTLICYSFQEYIKKKTAGETFSFRQPFLACYTCQDL